jgi:hypothetical protein
VLRDIDILWVYRKHGLEDELAGDLFARTGRELTVACELHGIECQVLQ